MSDPNVPVPTEIQLGDNWYRLGTVDARTQLHIMRRIAPLSGITVLTQGDLVRIAYVMAQMPEEDVNYILDKTLAKVSRKSGDGWAPIMTSQGTLAFADIGGVEQFQLAQAAIRVFQDPFYAMLASVMK